ncbi:MAG: dTDP-4-dehydrorhamnose 3,5-epimerase family protein [Rhodothermia bacterium]
MNVIPIEWRDGEIHDCSITPLKKYYDDRGWLAEFFRHDELESGEYPVMGYLSLTNPGIARGPHEHHDQSDLFVFFSGTFRLFLWDARPDSPSFGIRQIVDLGVENPASAIVPPGVVHAYRNVGDDDALIINCPNRLYAGWDKKESVDEIRHEDRDDEMFSMDY